MNPTSWERIFVEYRKIMKHHGAMIRHAARSVAVLFCLALALEVFVFNFNYWDSRSYNEVDLSSGIDLPLSKSGDLLFTESNHVIEFSHLNKHVRNIRIDFVSEQPAKNVQVKIQFTDEAHKAYFDSTSYTAGIPVRTVATNYDPSEYIKLSTSGNVDNLRLEVVGEDVSYPIAVSTVSINAPVPFIFERGRFLAAWCIAMLLYMFRPKSSIYSIFIVDHPRLSKTSVVFFTMVEMVLVTMFLFYGSNQVGIATSEYNWGAWDGVSYANTFEVGGDNAQQYSYLAEAMADGRLSLEIDPPEWLVEMDNPYDKGARDQLQKETGEEYLWDVAYYDGHYYVYFGAVPVILFYLPFYLLTRASFPTAIGVLVAVLAFILGCTALLDRFARYHFKRVSLGLYLLLQLPLIFCSGTMYLVKHPTFYSLPIMLALAFSVWGLYLWMRGRRSSHSRLCYALGSACMALVIGCRPQMVLLSFIAFPLFWRIYISEGRIRTKRGASEFACLIAPYVVVIAVIMWYNAARFGSPFDFGSNYNLTTNDMTRRGWDAGRILPALFAFFVQTPYTIGTFPFLQACTFDTTYMGQTIKEVTFGGIFATVPVLWLLILARRAIGMRARARRTHTVTGVMGVLIGGAVVVALADAEMAGILQRYYSDFTIMLLLVSILIAFIYNENLFMEELGMMLTTRVLPILVGLSLVYVFCLCFTPEADWYSSAYPWAYQRIVHLFQFWT